MQKELPPKKLGKRFALAGLALSAATLLFNSETNAGSSSADNTPSIPVPESNSPPLMERVSSPEEISSRIQEIENEFGIEINTFDDISQYPAIKLLYGLQNIIIPVNQEWNEDNLNLLENVFEYIPQDFYEPRNGEKVHIILGPAFHCGYDMKGFTPKYPYEVMLSYSLFKPEKPLTAALAGTHEFGHLKTTESCNSSLAPNYIDELEQILEKDFSKLQEELPSQIEKRANKFEAKVTEGGTFSSIDSLTPEEEETFRLTRLEYGTKNANEFMGVLFESYFMGKDYFGRMYDPFFGSSKTAELYSMIKGIYQGREFPDYHTTQQELEKAASSQG